MRIKISSSRYLSTEMVDMLANVTAASSLLAESIEVLGRPGVKRDLTPEVVIKLIEVGGEVLTALITGILTWLVAHRGNKIVIQDKSGNRIEVPSGASKEEIAECKRIIETMIIPRITLE